MRDTSADSVDQASDVEQGFRDSAIAAVRRPSRVPTDFDGSHCTECELNIPEARLHLGKWTCIDCQTLLEHQRKMFRS